MYVFYSSLNAQAQTLLCLWKVTCYTVAVGLLNVILLKMLDNGFFHDTNKIIFWQRENKNCHSQLCLNVLLLHVLVFVELRREAMKKILEEGLFMYNPLDENLMGCM